MPLVSVIIPVYKTEEYLPRCIDSLLAQTLQDLEIILVDDASPDRCGEICDSYAEKHSNIQVIHKENGGPLLARIAGMEIAQGKYLAFLDSDDWVLPDMYAPMVELAELHNADIVATGFIRDYGTRLAPYCNEIPSGVYREESLLWLQENAIFHLDTMSQALAPCVWNKLFRRDTMAEPILQAKAGISFAEDALTTFSALFASRCVVVMNELQPIRYQIREGSITNSYHKKYMHDIFIAYDRMMQLTEQKKSEAIFNAIAYNYIFLYIGGIAQEMGKANPANKRERRQHIKEYAQDPRLPACLQRVELFRYSKRIRMTLQLLSAGRYRIYLAFHFTCRILDKAKSLRKKVSG